MNRSSNNLVIIIALSVIILMMSTLVALADFNGAINQTYTYRTIATDPDSGDLLRYDFDWGDVGGVETFPPLTDPPKSEGTSVDATHAYTSASAPGTYDAFSVAFDDEGGRSGNSNIVSAMIQLPSTPGTSKLCQVTTVGNWNSACVSSSAAGANAGTFTIAWTASDPWLQTQISQYIAQRTCTGPCGGLPGTDTVYASANHGSGITLYGMDQTAMNTGCYTYQIQAEDDITPTSNFSAISGQTNSIIVDALAPSQMSAPTVQGAVNNYSEDTSPTWEFSGTTDNGSDDCWDSGMDYYNFKITTDIAGNNIYEPPVQVNHTGTGIHTHTQTVSPLGTYYGFVQGVDMVGNTSSWSPAGQITITSGAKPSPNWDYCSTDLADTIQFVDLSDPSPGEIVNYWYWDFGDGEKCDSNVDIGCQNPLHTYVPDTTPPPDPTCAPPPSGFTHTFNNSVDVTCSDTEPGVIIRYTTDGSEPDGTSAQYISPLNFTANTTLKVRAWDAANNASGINTYTYTLNSGPNAVDDSDNASPNETRTIAVLNNDSDPDGLDVTSVNIVSDPDNLSPTANADGTVTYTAPGSDGVYTFTYTVDDTLGATSNVATVTVNVSSAPPGWWNTAWKRRRKITFDNSGQAENLTSFPVLVELTGGVNIDYGQTQNQGQDLRFIDEDTANCEPGNISGSFCVLDYEIERWDEVGVSYVWVEVPLIDGGSNTDFMWMYYGNSSAALGEDASGTWNSDYALVLHLNNDFADSTQNNHNGTNNGSTNIAGKIADSQNFSGSGQWITVSDHADFDNTAGITMEAWVYNNDFGGEYRGIMVKGRDNPSQSYWQGIFRNNDFAGKWHIRSGGKRDNDTNWAPIGSWVYLVATINKGGPFALYENGSNIAGGNNWPGEPIDGSEDLAIGRALGISEYFKGRIDEVRWSKTIRSQDWIKAQYSSMNDTFMTYGSEESVAYNTRGVRVVLQSIQKNILRISQIIQNSVRQLYKKGKEVATRWSDSIVSLFETAIALATNPGPGGPYNVQLTVQDTGGGFDTGPLVELDFDRSCNFQIINVTAPTCTSIDVVEWSHANGANQYVVFWDLDTDPTNGQVGSEAIQRDDPSYCNASGCTYSISGLDPATLYYIYVQAYPTGFYNDFGACTGTQSTPCTVSKRTPPCPVTNVESDVSECGSITVKWQPADGAAGGYDIYRDFSSTNLPLDGANPGSMTPLNSTSRMPGGGDFTIDIQGKINYRDSEIVARKKYYYRIFAFNQDGEAADGRDTSAQNFCFKGPTFEEK